MTAFFKCFRLIRIVFLYSLVISACQPTVLPSTATPPTPSATAKPTIQLREERREEAGGYAYQPIPGYQVASDSGVVTMLAFGADPNYGPSLTLYGGEPDPGTTAQLLLDQLKGDKNTRLSTPEAVEIGGYEGLAADIIILHNEVELHGRIAVVVTPELQFVALAASLPPRWKSELLPSFEAVLDSINFFPPSITPEPSLQPVQTPEPSP